MKAPTLPDVLEALAARLPDRFSLSEGRAGGTVKLLGRDDEADEWINLGWWPETGGGYVVRDRDLRALLEQECEARGWAWDTGRGFGGCFASIGNRARWESTGENEMYVIASADTPAEALCLALLDALEAQS